MKEKHLPFNPTVDLWPWGHFDMGFFGFVRWVDQDWNVSPRSFSLHGEIWNSNRFK